MLSAMGAYGVSTGSYHAFIYVAYLPIPQSPGYAPRAFLCCDGMMRDLNTLIDPGSPLADITLDAAVGINNRGVILANGTDAMGQRRAYMLSPE